MYQYTTISAAGLLSQSRSHLVVGKFVAALNTCATNLTIVQSININYALI